MVTVTFGTSRKRLEDGQEEEPFPHPVESFASAQGGDDDDDHADDRHGPQQPEVVAAAHDRRDGIEHRLQLGDVPVGIDLVHFAFPYRLCPS
jgi:hypothetical protein